MKTYTILSRLIFVCLETHPYVCNNNKNEQVTHMKEREERYMGWFEGKKRNGEKIYLQCKSTILNDSNAMQFNPNLV